MAARRFLDPNLARAPFENSRPVRRLSALLWVLALAVGAMTYWLTSTARADAAARRAELEKVTAESVALRESAASRRAALEAAELAQRNQRTRFLNERIAERAFSWNDLFDALGDVLPRGVRIQSLSPQGFRIDSARPERSQSLASAEIALKIAGEAEETDSMLELVDRLFVHRAFREPNLARESTKRDDRVTFSLTVAYVPGWRGSTVVASEAPSDAASSAAAGTAIGREPADRAPAGRGASPATAGSPGGAEGSAVADGAPVEIAPRGAAPAKVGAPPGAADSTLVAPGAARGAAARSRPGEAAAGRADGPSAWGEGDVETREQEGEPREATGRGRETPAPLPLREGAPGRLLPAPLKPFASPPVAVR